MCAANTQPNTTPDRATPKCRAAEGDRGRHGGHPVQAVEHDEDEQVAGGCPDRAGPARTAATARGSRSSRTSSSRGSTLSVSQPDAIVPTRSNNPIRASSPAAVVSGMPWSCAAGMKWVPIRPFVDQPQIQKVPNRIQNVRDRALWRSVRTASLAGPTCDPVCRVAGSSSASPGCAPQGPQAEVGRPVPDDEQHQRHEQQRRAGDDERPPSASPARSRAPRCRAGRPAGRPRRPPRRPR